MIRSFLASILAATALLPPAAAGASAAVEALLLQADRPTTLRARLFAHADSAPDSAARGEALLLAGVSYERDGEPDSAIACYEKAIALRGEGAERDALAEALCLRGRPGDADRAIETLVPLVERGREDLQREAADAKGLIAWAHYVAGRGDTALARMRAQQWWLLHNFNPRQRAWRYRLGLLELERGDPQRSISLLSPLALDSRFKDSDVMGILRDAAQKAGMLANLEFSLRTQLRRFDEVESAGTEAVRGRPASFTGTDGFPLGGVTLAPAVQARARAAIVLVPHGEFHDAFDSLATGLRRAGYAVMLLDVRGWGASVAPDCPLPETWRGRESLMIDAAARDVVPALRALAGVARIDTTRYVIVGPGMAAPIAAVAAAQDARARILVFLSPDPSPVDRGPLRARLAELRRPVFFMVPSTDGRTLPLVEALYEAVDPRASRIVESDRIGSGARVFNHDPAALPRLTRWLDESWPAAAARPTRR